MNAPIRNIANRFPFNIASRQFLLSSASFLFVAVIAAIVLSATNPFPAHAQEASNQPDISGVARSGSTLASTKGTILDTDGIPDGEVFGAQWIRVS